MTSTRICVKVAELRKKYEDNSITLKSWLENKDNMYVGRHGRIFIDKEIFVYKASKWANPFTVKDHGLNKCLELYKTFILDKIKADKELYNIEELRNKSLGCWCQLKDKCHVDILLELLKMEKN